MRDDADRRHGSGGRVTRRNGREHHVAIFLDDADDDDDDDDNDDDEDDYEDE